MKWLFLCSGIVASSIMTYNEITWLLWDNSPEAVTKMEMISHTHTHTEWGDDVTDNTIIFSKCCNLKGGSSVTMIIFPAGSWTKHLNTSEHVHSVSYSTSVSPFETNVSWSPSSPPAPPDRFELAGRRNKESAITRADDQYVCSLSLYAELLTFENVSLFQLLCCRPLTQTPEKDSDTSISGNLFLERLLCVSSSSHWVHVKWKKKKKQAEMLLFWRDELTACDIFYEVVFLWIYRHWGWGGAVNHVVGKMVDSEREQ